MLFTSCGQSTEEVGTESARLLPADLGSGMFGPEPHLAVDPNNPNNLALGQFMSVAVANGLQPGTNIPAFQAPQVLQIDPAIYTAGNGDPVLAYDSQGRLWLTVLALRRAGGGRHVLVQRVDPTSGAAISADGSACPSAPIACPTEVSSGSGDDKPWIAIDTNPSSPYRDRIYVVWVDLAFDLDGDGTAAEWAIMTSFSDDGVNWSTPEVHNTMEEGEVWPPSIGVMPNGDVWITYHSQPAMMAGDCFPQTPGLNCYNGFNHDSEPTGTDGQIVAVVSKTGGTFDNDMIPGPDLKTIPFPQGRRTSPGTIRPRPRAAPASPSARAG
jgi:hypothetical protein